MAPIGHMGHDSWRHASHRPLTAEPVVLASRMIGDWWYQCIASTVSYLVMCTAQYSLFELVSASVCDRYLP